MFPSGIEGLCGLMAMETRAAALTLSVVVVLIEPELTPIVVVPTPKLVARPTLPAASLIVATVASEEVQ